MKGKCRQGERLTVVIGAVNEQGFLVVRSVANQPSMKATYNRFFEDDDDKCWFSFGKNRDLLSAATSRQQMAEPLMRKSSPIYSIS